MAEKKFSELTAAAILGNDDIFALSQIDSGSLTSKKTTLTAIANHINTVVQYTNAYGTQAKTTAGAINELKQLISLIPQFSIEVVEELPTEDISDTTIYLVPAEDPEVGNYYEEYIHVNNTWELVGTTAVDLSAYYTKLEVDGLLADKLEADDFEASQTASANPITLETKQAGLAKSCVVEMNPIQDLNGYDHPWAGGAGKNKAPLTLANIKALNTYGQWNGNVYTYNGIDYTVNLDEAGNVVSIKANGTESSNSSLYFVVTGTSTLAVYLTNGTNYILSGCTGGSSTDYSVQAQVNGSWYANYDGDTQFTYTSGGTDRLRIYIPSGSRVTNVMFYPMVRLATVTDATFAPYSNICPISGRTEASVKRTGKNFFNTALFQRKAISGGTGESFDSTTRIMSNDVIVEAGSYTYQNSNDYKTALYVYNADGSYPAPENEANLSTTNPRTVTFGGKRIVRLIFAKSDNATITLDEIGEVQIEKGSTATAYEPYTAETHTHQYGQTVYGGEDDFVNGKLIVDIPSTAKVKLSDLNWTYQSAQSRFYTADLASLIKKPSTSSDIPSGMMCECYKIDSFSNLSNGKIAVATSGNLFAKDENYTDVTTWLNAVGDYYIAYPLATPTTIQLSPEALTLLKGLNVISTDGNKVQVEFSDIPVGDYSTLLDYVKSLEARIQNLES